MSLRCKEVGSLRMGESGGIIGIVRPHRLELPACRSAFHGVELQLEATAPGVARSGGGRVSGPLCPQQ